MNFTRRKFLLGLAAVTGSSQVSRPSNQSQPPLAFIHGIKGSVLVDAQGSERWINTWQVLGLSTPDLKLPLRWQGNVQDRDGIVATMPLASVAWHNIYAPFLNWATTSGRKFRAYAYDWRRDNLETTEGFIQFLERFRDENGGARIQLVAHSMGGLISFVALNRRPDLFHSILLAGVPFGSSISFLEDMHSGAANGLNNSILSPAVYFSFSSPYTFFPSNPKESGLVEKNGTPIEHDWYSADDWARQKLGIFALSPSTGGSAEQRAHLIKALERARLFRSGLAFSGTFHYPPMAALVGQGVPTITTVMRNGSRSVRGWDFAAAPRESGDGRIEFSRAMPPIGVPYKIFRSSRTHEDLLSDTKQVDDILRQLITSV